MRFAARAMLLVLALAAPAAAKKPEPVECPSDVLAAMAVACPCDGTLEPWKNHGQYVRCVVHLRNAYRKAGCLDDTLKRTITRCAARSTCGKDGAVLCCKYDLGTCSDATPGDAVPAGVCSNDAALACDVAPDCTKSSGSVVRDDATCSERNGVAVGSGSVCTPCPPPAE